MSAEPVPKAAFADALTRAREAAAKINKVTEGVASSSSGGGGGIPAPGGGGLKRPSSSDESQLFPPEKKPSLLDGAGSVSDPYVAQIIAKKQAAAAAAAMDGTFGAPDGGMDSGLGGMGAGGGEAPQTEMIMVPDKMVGLIIGRGGEQITRLQAESGCKIQMAQDSAGLPERQCTLTGGPTAILAAKSAIDRIIANEGNGVGPGGPRPSMGPSGGGGGFYEQMVPGHKVGLIIGKGGEMIKQLQEQSGAKIVIIQDTPEAAMEKPLRITGTPEGVEIAKQLVNDILAQTDDREGGGFGMRGRGRGMGRGGFRGRGGPGMGRGGRGGYGGGGQWGSPGGGDYGGAQHTDYVQVPSNKCGLIIGKGGETIKQINQSTGAHCEVDKSAPPDARDKNFIIRGSPEAVERAKSMILDKLGMQGGPYGGYGGDSQWGGNSGGGGYGGASGGYGGAAGAPGGAAPGGAPGGGAAGADYSAQWAEYYRSMGMHKEAEAIEQARNSGAAAQPAAAPAAPAPAASNGGGAGNGTDYSQQWAEYYRSIGKIKEAEQIEQQMKQKTGGAPGGPPYGQQQQYAGYYGN